MSVKNLAFLSIEATLQRRVTALFREFIRPTLRTVTQLVAEQHYSEAQSVLAKITLEPLCIQAKPDLELAAIQSVLFGVSQAGGDLIRTRTVRDRRLPPLTMSAVDQMVSMLCTSMVEQLRNRAIWVVELAQQGDSTAPLGASEQDFEAAIRRVAKADFPFAEQLNAAVMGTGGALIDIAGNLTTTRLAAYGFLVEADDKGLTTYQISEVLDSRTCPFCRGIHGMTFQVSAALDHVEQALTTQDPAELKATRPFIKTDRKSLAKVAASTTDELQAMGFDTPPFHPSCLPGGTLVSACGRIAAQSRRWYEGDLVVVHTARGHKLRLTPNHPVLTNEGWVAAGLLDVGSRVVEGRGVQGPVAGLVPEYQHVEARIEDVFETLRRTSGMTTREVPGAPEDFHGDGGYEQVDVVGFGGSEGLNEVRHRFLGDVALDRVVGVGRESFAGHVYNLETEDGFYVAGSLIVHNCRGILQLLGTVTENVVGFDEFLVEEEDPLQSVEEVVVSTGETTQQQDKPAIGRFSADWPSKQTGSPDSFFFDGEEFERISSSSGSNEGGFYKSPTRELFAKFPSSVGQVGAERVSADIAKAMGLQTKKYQSFALDSGHVAIASDVIEIKQLGGAALAGFADQEQLRKQFVHAAFTGNWDVVGLGFDNLVLVDGKLTVVDYGGSLLWRAQGELKGPGQFSSEVTELFSLRNQKTNAQAHAVFGHLTDAEIAISIKQSLSGIDASHIAQSVLAHGQAFQVTELSTIIDTLVERRNTMLTWADQVLEKTKGGLTTDKFMEVLSGTKSIGQVAPAQDVLSPTKEVLVPDLNFEIEKINLSGKGFEEFLSEGRAAFNGQALDKIVDADLSSKEADSVFKNLNKALKGGFSESVTAEIQEESNDLTVTVGSKPSLFYTDAFGKSSTSGIGDTIQNAFWLDTRSSALDVIEFLNKPTDLVRIVALPGTKIGIGESADGKTTVSRRSWFSPTTKFVLVDAEILNPFGDPSILSSDNHRVFTVVAYDEANPPAFVKKIVKAGPLVPAAAKPPPQLPKPKPEPSNPNAQGSFVEGDGLVIDQIDPSASADQMVKDSKASFRDPVTDEQIRLQKAREALQSFSRTNDFTAKEKFSLKGYQGIGYRSINQGLRRGDSVAFARHNKDIENLDSAIEKSRTPTAFSVFRTLKVPEDGRISGVPIDDFEEGTVFTEKAFGSWSQDVVESIGSFSGHGTEDPVVFALKMPKGSNAVWMDNLEHEFLLPRNTTFRVVSVNRGYKADLGIRASSTVTLIEVELLNDK